MPTADGLAFSPPIEAAPAPIRRRDDGIRVVSRDNGRYLDLLPSQLSPYLLPPLADCSVLRREARLAIGLLRFGGDAVEIVEIVESDHLHGWFTALSTAAGITVTVGLNRTHAISNVELAATPSVVIAPDTPGVAEHAVQTTALPFHRLPADASVSAIASQIATLSGLGDEQLAELFKVERETFCRWRTGTLTNPRIGNRRRLGLLLALVEDLAAREVSIRDWLLNSISAGGSTPYELLAEGRIDEVAYLAAALVDADGTARDPQVASAKEVEPLQFGDDDSWDYDALQDDE